MSLLIGFALFGAGILFAVLVDYRDVSLNNTECSISNVFLYNTGKDRTYFVASLHNLGSRTIASASVTFVDDSGIEHGFTNDSLAIDPGHTWEMKDSFHASVSTKKIYVIRAIATADDASMASCSVTYEIKS